MIKRIIIITFLIISYKFIPVFEPIGFNYLVSIFILGAIVFETHKIWKQLSLNESKKKKIQKITYLVMLSAVFMIIILNIHKDNPSGNIRFIRAALILVTIALGSKILKEIFRSKISNYLKNSILLFFSVAVFLGLLEICFMFISLSHGSGEAFSGKIWIARCWKPINNYGFRDEEPKHAKNSVFFIGDSFTAGWGVKNSEERFSEITASELLKKGIKINEINLGRFGADTKLEFQLLKNFIRKSNIHPKHVILQYFVNDMDQFIPTNKKCISKSIKEPKWKQIVIQGSYLTNYLASLYPNYNTNKVLPKECEYTEQLKYIYTTDSIWKKEENELNKFKNYCIQNNSKLTIVFFPFMEDLTLAKKLNIENRIKQYCKKYNISMINVSDFIDKIPRHIRQVSVTDSHASKEVHKRVGEILAKKIKI